MISVFLDNNLFDFLYENKIDISKEFPNNKFELWITKEIHFEIEPIRKIEKLNFVKQLLENKIIKVCSYLGFFEDNHTEEKQRTAGFGSIEEEDDDGMISCEEGTFENELDDMFPPDRPSNKPHGLDEEEADKILAVKSVHNIVLSFDDKKGKGKQKGPLNVAYEKGYKIIFLRDFNRQKESLNEFVKKDLKSRGFETW